MPRARPARVTRQCSKDDGREALVARASRRRTCTRVRPETGGARAPKVTRTDCRTPSCATVRGKLADIAGAVPEDGGVAASLTCGRLPRCDVVGRAAGRALRAASACMMSAAPAGGGDAGRPAPASAAAAAVRSAAGIVITTTKAALLIGSLLSSPTSTGGSLAPEPARGLRPDRSPAVSRATPATTLLTALSGCSQAWLRPHST
jgi:hypothetical protein